MAGSCGVGRRRRPPFPHSTSVRSSPGRTTPGPGRIPVDAAIATSTRARRTGGRLTVPNQWLRLVGDGTAGATGTSSIPAPDTVRSSWAALDREADPRTSLEASTGARLSALIKSVPGPAIMWLVLDLCAVSCGICTPMKSSGSVLCAFGPGVPGRGSPSDFCWPALLRGRLSADGDYVLSEVLAANPDMASNGFDTSTGNGIDNTCVMST